MPIRYFFSSSIKILSSDSQLLIPCTPASPSPDFEAGEILLVDKPLGWSSFDAVAKVRNTIRTKKVGHAGTLDPMATGLLVLCTGKKTKLIEQIQAGAKTYEALLRLGAATPCYDAELPPTGFVDASHITAGQLEAVFPQFIGTVWQRPPAHSAVKIGGKRAYDLARSGKDPEPEPRQVQIHRIELLEMGVEGLFAHIRVHCGKGVYIRTLAHDIGQALGVGAYLAGLRRTEIAPYSVADAWTIPQLVERFGRK